VDDIALDLDVSTNGALLQRIAAMLARRSQLVETEVLDSLRLREELGSTALGHGVAIPHARMARCNAAAGAFVRTRLAIPFNAPDGKPVSNFLGLIVPRQANERHLKLLATAAAMFSDRGFRERLGACVDPAQALELFTSWSD
jgi:nitrogen PTS system EIIA component